MKWKNYLEWIRNLKIRQKTILIIILMTFFIIIVGFTGYFFSKKNAIVMDDMYTNRLLPVEQLNIIRSNLNQVHNNLQEMSIPDNKNRLFDLTESNNELMFDTDKQLSDYKATKLDSYEIENLPKLQSLLKELESVIQNINQQCIIGNYATGFKLIKENESKFDKAVDIASKLAKYNKKVASEINIQGNKNAALGNIIILSVILLSLIISIPFGFFLAQMISYPLTVLLNKMQKVADGDLSVEPVKIQSTEEVGQLGTAFNSMTQNLNNLFQKEQFLRKREQLLREVMTASMGSLNIQDILKTIVLQTGSLFNADRCFFIEYNLKNKEYDSIKDYAVYLSSLNFKSLTGVKFTNEQMTPFTNILFNQKQNIEVNNVNELQLPELTKKIFFEDSGVKSALFVPVFHRNKPLGIIAVDYINDYRQFSQEDVDLLSDIANQSAIFVYQAGLYSQLQEASDREKLLRVVINQVLVSENIDEATWNISKEISKIFDADRVNLRFFDPFQRTFTNITGEYRKNENIPSVIGKGSYKKEFNDYIVKKIFDEKEDLIMDNINSTQYPDFITENFKELGVKSAILCPIFHKNTPLALVAIANTESFKSWEKEEVDFLIPIIQQISIGINLFDLNNKLNQSLEGEKIARKIITEIRKSEDHDIIYNYLLEQLINIFNADKAYHAHYDDKYDLIIKNENLRDNKEKKLKI